MMPKVILIMPDGSSSPRSDYDFEVAPIIGSSIQLRVEGENHFYRVDDTWHAEAPEGDRIRYFAALVKDDAPERWATAEAYVLPIANEIEVELTGLNPDPKGRLVRP